MSYTNAIFRCDYVNGSDTARADLVPSAYADNGSGLVRVTVGSTAAIVTNAVVDIAGTTGSVYIGGWLVTVIDGTHIDLIGSAYTSNPATKGTCIPRGGDSWANAWQTITTGASSTRIAAGDTIQVAKSPDPTSLGITAQWTNGPIPATFVQTSSTNASPIVVTKASHGLSNGDIVQILGVTTNTTENGNWVVQNVTTNTFELAGSTGNGVGGATGTIQKINAKCVVLASATLTKTVSNCDVAWTAGLDGATVTATAVATDGKEGVGCMKIAMSGTVHASTMQAYKTMASTDFSGYQKISFWLKNSAAIVANNYIINLCSDTAGATPVDSFLVPAITSVNGWWPVTIIRNGGGNCGAAIQSVALYTGTVAPTASSNVFIDNIIACTTSGISLQSLISKNSAAQGGTETFYGIQSINGTIVQLDNDPATKGSAGKGYTGVTESVTTYIRETIKTTTAASTFATTQQSGSATSYVQYQGGYNTSSLAQDGETWFDSLSEIGDGIFINNAYILFNHVNVVRAHYGVGGSSGANTFSNLTANNCSIPVRFTGGTAYNFGNIILCNNGNVALEFLITYASTVTSLIANNNIGDGIHCYASNGNVFGSISSKNNTGYGLNFLNSSFLNNVFSLTTAANTNGGVSNDYGTNFLKNVSISEATQFASAVSSADSRVYVTDPSGTVPNIYTDGCTVTNAATDRSGGTGEMWKMMPTSTRTSAYPFRMSIGRFAVNANKAVTITAYMKMDSTTQCAGGIIVKANQLNGIGTSDISVAASTADTSWHNIQLANFTPTEAGVFELCAYAYYVSGNSNVYIGEIQVSQAS